MSRLALADFHLPAEVTSIPVRRFQSESSAGQRTSSIRSSDGDTDEGKDERARIQQKIDRIKEIITRVSLDREGDVEDFLAMSNNLGGGNENPQLLRVRQHFEKKNKKNAQEIEHLKKKLEQFQSRLRELDAGIVTEPSPRAAVLNNIRKTGPLIREVTGSVISAPKGIAHMIKNTFGSVDNIQNALETDSENVGHSTFYANVHLDSRRTNPFLTEDMESSSSSMMHRNNELSSQLLINTNSLSESNRKSNIVTFSVDSAEIKDDINELKTQNLLLTEQVNNLQANLKAEFNFYNSALHEERIKSQRLEELLNETIELHQAEMIALKSDLNTIGTRMDYQYCDRFRSIEENIESTQNRVIRMETSIKEWTETSPQSALNALMLSGVNILVEFLKLVLFIVSVALDFIKPFTGTRTKAGCVILFWMVLMISSHYVNFRHLIYEIAAILGLISSKETFLPEIPTNVEHNS